MWAPNDAMLDALGLDAPLPGVVYSGGVISSQPMYYWFAQEMARNGYVVHDLRRQRPGPQRGQRDRRRVADLRAAIDFFVSKRNPLHRMLDRSRIGTAGHSMGAGAVQTVADHCGVVKAISAHSDLRATYPDAAAPEGACGPRRPVPIQGQGADYESLHLPAAALAGQRPRGQARRLQGGARRGIDVQEVVIESGTHMAWSHVTWAYTASWSEQVAFHYALAWFDRYLYGDRRRDGADRQQRLATVLRRRRAPATACRRSSAPPTRSAARAATTWSPPAGCATPRALKKRRSRARARR